MTNKINLIIQDTDKIDGYENIYINDFQQKTNGSVDEIICTILDKLEYSARLNLLGAIVKKLSFEGTCTIKILNAFSILKHSLEGKINSKSLSDIINNSKSLLFESDMMDLFNQIQYIDVIKVYNVDKYLVMNISKNK